MFFIYFLLIDQHSKQKLQFGILASKMLGDLLLCFVLRMWSKL